MEADVTIRPLVENPNGLYLMMIRLNSIMPKNCLSEALPWAILLVTHAPRLSLSKMTRITGAFFYCADSHCRAPAFPGVLK